MGKEVFALACWCGLWRASGLLVQPCGKHGLRTLVSWSMEDSAGIQLACCKGGDRAYRVALSPSTAGLREKCVPDSSPDPSAPVCVSCVRAVVSFGLFTMLMQSAISDRLSLMQSAAISDRSSLTLVARH